jgi:hypothetical protein
MTRFWRVQGSHIAEGELKCYQHFTAPPHDGGGAGGSARSAERSLRADSRSITSMIQMSKPS